MKTLTPTQITQIQDTLAHARAGKATLAQLAAAHDLAEDATLNGTLGGLVVFGRDRALDSREAGKVNDWVRETNVTNEADERP